jgi:tetratricopeptide (TPR) repeat protein
MTPAETGNTMQLRTLVLTLLLVATSASAQPPAPRVNADTERANVHYRLGWEALRAEAWAEAAKEFQQAIDLDSKFKLAHYGLGRSLMALRRFDEAAKAYETCRGLYENQASEKFTGQFDADKMRQDDQQQIEMAIRSLQGRSQSQSLTTQTRIAELRAQLQRIQMKREAGRDMSLQSVVPAFVSLALGSAYFRQERFEDAERAYKAAIDDDPKVGEAHNNLAVLYMMTGRLDESAKEVTLAEKSGYRVNPQFKQDLETKRKGR